MVIYSIAPKTPKIDTDEFDGKIQQLITMGISEVRLNLIDNETLDHVPSSCMYYSSTCACGKRSSI